MKISLKKPNLREVPVGTIVETSLGFDFELISRDEKGKESWKDLTSGIIWDDIEDKKYTQIEAMEKFGERLPTIEMFEEAETHGFREVLPNMNNWFWSASPYRNVAFFAQEFNGSNGYSGYDNRVSDESVRCVGR